ncbi:hypothetical protein RV11_GL001518 [Enterococcus phoeniculicola]|jgi:hypothetical protein|nr:hypothetical protein RV11_GL001518 [Enterococcus phoeniculicola]
MEPWGLFFKKFRNQAFNIDSFVFNLFLLGYNERDYSGNSTM